MYKTGIYKKEQLTPEQLFSKSGRRKFIALDLYESYIGSIEERDRFQEQAIGRLAMTNGSFKKTHKNRFNDFDKKALSTIGELYPEDHILKVHDLAISDGRTTVPFFNVLGQGYQLNLEFLASDYAAEFVSLQRKGTKRRIILDKNDNVIQYIWPPFVFNKVWPELGLYYPVNFIVRRALVWRLAEKAKRDFKKHPEQFVKKEILLLCEECKAVMEDPRFTFRAYDLLAGPSGYHHVIRAMNILNDSYFTPEQMRVAVANIASSLAEGGILITGSNEEGGTEVRGGIYRKNGKHFDALFETGGGSPARAYILKIAD
jgi:hypothetical protein